MHLLPRFNTIRIRDYVVCVEIIMLNLIQETTREMVYMIPESFPEITMLATSSLLRFNLQQTIEDGLNSVCAHTPMNKQLKFLR